VAWVSALELSGLELGSRFELQAWNGPEVEVPNLVSIPTLETTQGQIDGFFSQLLYTCYFGEVTSVGD
jgi:hypothetical protein